LFSSVQKNTLFCTKDCILLYKNTIRCLGGFQKDGECLKKSGECFQKDQAGWEDIKPVATFSGISLLILPLLIRLDYYIIVILKQALLKMEDNTMRSRIK